MTFMEKLSVKIRRYRINAIAWIIADYLAERERLVAEETAYQASADVADPNYEPFSISPVPYVRSNETCP